MKLLFCAILVVVFLIFLVGIVYELAKKLPEAERVKTFNNIIQLFIGVGFGVVVGTAMAAFMFEVLPKLRLYEWLHGLI